MSKYHELTEKLIMYICYPEDIPGIDKAIWEWLESKVKSWYNTSYSEEDLKETNLYKHLGLKPGPEYCKCDRFWCEHMVAYVCNNWHFKYTDTGLPGGSIISAERFKVCPICAKPNPDLEPICPKCGKSKGAYL